MTYYSQPQPETPARRQQGQVCRLQKTISAVLVAAGSSTRMGFDKLSFDLGGETVLHRSIRAFDQCPQIGEIVLVAGKNRAFVEQQAVASGPRAPQSRCRSWPVVPPAPRAPRMACWQPTGSWWLCTTQPGPL